MNSYRFVSGQEPSDEMLSQLMKEVAEEANSENQRAAEAHFAQMRSNAVTVGGGKNHRFNLSDAAMLKDNHKPELIVIAGPNGSGKTSVTQRFLHHAWAEGTIYINPDEVAKVKFGDWNSHEAIRFLMAFFVRYRCYFTMAVTSFSSAIISLSSRWSGLYLPRGMSLRM